MKFTPRRAHAADLHEIRELDRAHSPVFSSPDAYARFLSGDGLLLVTPGNEHLVALAAWETVLDESSLLNLVVHPSCRRQSLASDLIAASFAALTTAGASTFHLEVRESNAAAIALYEHCGFQKVGYRRAYYASIDGRPREAAILMRRAGDEREDCV